MNRENVDIQTIDNGFDFYFLESEAYITATNIHENGRGIQAEICIERPPQTPIKSNITVHLQDHTARLKLAQELAVSYQDEFLPWGEIIDFVCNETIYRHRKPPDIQDINTEPQTKKVEYLTEPILALGQPTTIYSMGGKGKSIFADYLSVSITYGLADELQLVSNKGNVLYLDWESDAEIHRRYITAIENGLGIAQDERRPISYMNCDQPLNNYIEYLRQLIREKEIDLVIIDSQMAATSDNPHGMTDAQVSGQYYNNLKSLCVTTLTIDHVSKQAGLNENNNSGPYGSVVKYNRSRSQFEIKVSQEIDADYIELALVHNKFNLGRKQKPLGIRIDFTNNESNELEKITFSPCDLADNPELEKTLPQKTRIRNLLLDSGLMDPKDIAEKTGIPEANVRTICNREKNMFVKNGTFWGVLDRNITT